MESATYTQLTVYQTGKCHSNGQSSDRIVSWFRVLKWLVVFVMAELSLVNENNLPAVG